MDLIHRLQKEKKEIWDGREGAEEGVVIVDVTQKQKKARIFHYFSFLFYCDVTKILKHFFAILQFSTVNIIKPKIYFVVASLKRHKGSTIIRNTFSYFV